MMFKYLALTLTLVSLLFLTSCDDVSVKEDLEQLGENVESVSEDIQSGSNDLITSILVDVTDVYIAKGNTQCNDDGLSLEETTAYLTAADIEVSASQCGIIEGISFASVCGGGTADIYIHTINTVDIIDATNLGFMATSLLATDSLSFTVVDCPTS